MVTIRDRAEDLVNRSTVRVWKTALSYTPVGGVATIVTPAGGTLYGVFDSAYEVTVERDGMEVADRAPMLEVVLEDLAVAPVRGDLFTMLDGPHSGESYTVLEVHYDSAQAARLMCVGGSHV